MNTEHFVLPLSHDEVVHGKGSLLGKMPGDEWQRFANLRCLLANQFTQPGKKLLFMGSELAPPTEWDHDAPCRGSWPSSRCGRRSAATWRTSDGSTASLRRCGPPIPSPARFAWIDASDVESSVFSYIRRGGDAIAVVVQNLTPVPRPDYRLGLPSGGRWVEVLNSDSEHYGGSNVGNLGGLDAADEPWHGQPASLRLVLPPLATVVLVPEG